MKYMRWLVLGFVGAIGCSSEGSGPSATPAPPPTESPPPCPGTPKLLATGLRPGASDGAALYAFAPQSIERMPLGGGELATSVRGIDTSIDFGLNVSGQWLYWGARGVGVIRAPLYDGPTFVVADARDVQHFAVSGDDVFFLVNGDVWRVPADGHAQPVLFQADGHITDIAIAGQSVYLAGHWTEGAAVNVVGTGGGIMHGVSSWFAQAGGHIAAMQSGDDVFVTDGSEGSVRRIDTRNGNVTLIFDTGAYNGTFDPYRGQIAFDAGNVYTIVEPHLWRIAADGSAKQVMADGVTAFSIAGKWLYYQQADALYGVCK